MPKKCKACNNSVFGGGYCRMHQYMRLDKITKPSQPRKPINHISKKTRKKVAEYCDVREVFLEENPLCQAKLENCSVIATDVHHKKGRGKYLIDISTFLAVCRSCHHIIEENPKLAKELNLSHSRLKK